MEHGLMEYEVLLNTLWVLTASFLVFLMHAGFAMVESGFARTKNVVNVLMKNMVTVMTGVVTFLFTGFALMFGNDVGGFFGSSGFLMAGLSDMDFGIPSMAFWVFQAMFAATCATIVSGAVAERVKFQAYLLFTVAITALVYPVVGHWVWGGGWLSALGFHDFAGSTVVHSVGAWGALVFAAMLGPRIGKYSKEGKVQPLFGHSLPLGTLGVLLLWFGWFGFNGGSTLSVSSDLLPSVIAVTVLGGAAGGLAAMILSWLQHGHADASLTLNGILAGLVGITAGADVFTPAGAILSGGLAGLVLVLAVQFFDAVVKVDDAVGAVSVHGIGGVIGTLAVGLFSVEGGLFYGGGVDLLLVQLLGVGAVLAWTVTLSLISLAVIQALVGLRVSAEEEIEGLDMWEHGVIAYGDFMIHSLGDFRRSVNTHGATSRSEEIRKGALPAKGIG